VLVISTNGQHIADEPKIMADMGIIWNAAGARINITDSFNHYSGKIGIEIRGQSSQMFPMKPYSIKLWNSSGSSVNKSLFGLPSKSYCVLYASYNKKILVHNLGAYTLSRELGRWAANCRYVELVLNGEYKGIYVFMEKIKRKAGRVNIPSMSSTDNSGDAVTLPVSYRGGSGGEINEFKSDWWKRKDNIRNVAVVTFFVLALKNIVASKKKALKTAPYKYFFKIIYSTTSPSIS
jgi:hypothetical protein